MNLNRSEKIVVGLLAALMCCGIGAWIVQLANGLGVTGMNNGVSWGLYIACFMLFVGLSAGGLIVASSASVFHVIAYKKVAYPAIIVSTVCICAAAALVLIDMGGVQRVLNLFTSPNFTSPLMWDVCVIIVYLVLNVLYLVLMRRFGVESHAVTVVSRFALPVAILVHSVTAWIFGLQIAKEGWNSAIMAPLFVVSAMDSGLALLLLVLMGMRRHNVFDVEDGLIANLAGLLVTCVAIDGFLVGCEVLTVAYSGTASGLALLTQMTAGATAPFFWFEVVFGVLVPFAILVFERNRRRPGMVALASVLVVAGVFCKRVWLLLTSFMDFNIAGAPGVGVGNAAVIGDEGGMWALAGSYTPTAIEVVVVAGVVSACVLAVMLLSRALLRSGKAVR